MGSWTAEDEAACREAEADVRRYEAKAASSKTVEEAKANWAKRQAAVGRWDAAIYNAGDTA
jgi:hypothetical protein